MDNLLHKSARPYPQADTTEVQHAYWLTLLLPCYTSSCGEIKTQYPNSLSDYYTIIDGTGCARYVYCEMGQVCGSSGWTRMAYLNMSDPTEECPSGFRLYSQNGVRACGRPVTSGGSCQSVCLSLYTTSTLRSADDSMAPKWHIHLMLNSLLQVINSTYGVDASVLQASCTVYVTCNFRQSTVIM